MLITSYFNHCLSPSVSAPTSPKLSPKSVSFSLLQPYRLSSSPLLNPSDSLPCGASGAPVLSFRLPAQTTCWFGLLILPVGHCFLECWLNFGEGLCTCLWSQNCREDGSVIRINFGPMRVYWQKLPRWSPAHYHANVSFSFLLVSVFVRSLICIWVFWVTSCL